MLEKSGAEKCLTSRKAVGKSVGEECCREVLDRCVRGVVGQKCCKEVSYKSIRGLVWSMSVVKKKL